MTDPMRDLVDKITAEWADKGKILEGGWQAFVATSGLVTAPDIQRREMRNGYFVGCQHLFASIMSLLDPGTEPTDRDLHRFSLIHEELVAWQKDHAQDHAHVADQPAQTLGDGPIDSEYRQQMVEVAKFVNEYFNGSAPVGERKTGFVLLVFPFHPFDGRCNYLSNGVDRRDIVTLFKEQIARFEGMPEAQGRA